jgi:hypothetical protein
LAIVTILACARMRADASLTLGRQAAEQDVMFRLTRIYYPLLIGKNWLVLDVTGNPFQKWVEGSRRFCE